jgi:hypothetical protein
MTRSASIFSWGAFAALLGCTSDHDLLAQRPGPTSDGSVSDTGADDFFPPNPRDVQMSVDARDPEPPGPWVLTLVNGVVDASSVRFCFVPVVDGGEAPGDDAPFPAAPGLSFGAHLVLDAIGTIDLRTTDVHPYLVVGANGPGAATCRQLLRPGAADAGPDASGLGPGPVAVSLPLVPAGTLGESRSYLAVATGCALPPPPRLDAGTGADAGDGGEAGNADAAPVDVEALARAAACGPALGPTSLGLSLVRLSRRTSYAKVGFQVVNGSNAAAPASFIIDNSFTNLTLFFGDTLALGQIYPHAQPGYIDNDDFPPLVGALDLFVDPPTGFSNFPRFQTTLSPVLSSSHVDPTELTGGSLFTFVLLGALPGSDAGQTSNPFRIELVPSAPIPADD